DERAARPGFRAMLRVVKEAQRTECYAQVRRGFRGQPAVARRNSHALAAEMLAVAQHLEFDAARRGSSYRRGAKEQDREAGNGARARNLEMHSRLLLSPIGPTRGAWPRITRDDPICRAPRSPKQCRTRSPPSFVSLARCCA